MRMIRRCLILGAVAAALTGFSIRPAQASLVGLLGLNTATTITPAAGPSAPPLGVAPATPVTPTGPVIFN